jgi:hypothetical protein
MKRLTVFLLVAGFMPWISCKGEDGSVQGDKKEQSSSAATFEQTAAPRRPNRVGQARQLSASKYRSWHLAKNWRISYYLHAHATPWWPNAPGD